VWKWIGEGMEHLSVASVRIVALQASGSFEKDLKWSENGLSAMNDSDL